MLYIRQKIMIKYLGPFGLLLFILFIASCKEKIFPDMRPYHPKSSPIGLAPEKGRRPDQWGNHCCETKRIYRPSSDGTKDYIYKNAEVKRTWKGSIGKLLRVQGSKVTMTNLTYKEWLLEPQEIIHKRSDCCKHCKHSPHACKDSIVHWARKLSGHVTIKKDLSFMGRPKIIGLFKKELKINIGKVQFVAGKETKLDFDEEWFFATRPHDDCSEKSYTKIEIGQPEAVPSEIAGVPIFISTDIPIGGFKFYIEYDPTVLTLLDVERGELIDDFDGYYDEYGHIPRYLFQYFEHRMLPCAQQCETYKIKIVGIADMPDDWITGPLEAGEGELIKLRFKVANDANLKALKTRIKWEWDDSICTENTLTDSTGCVLLVSTNPDQFDTLECAATGPNYDIWPNVHFIDGGVDISGEGLGWIGDINVNQYPYEIADAVLFSNYFLYGEEVFEYDPYWRDIQINATDVNQDGFVLSMSDFVFLVRIILEDISPKHKLVPSEDLVDVILTTQGDAVKVKSFSNTTIGAGLYVFRHSGEVKNLITHTDMDVKYHAADGELRVLVYSFKAKSIPAGAAELFSFEAKDVELVQVEATDFYGSTLKSTISTKVLPTEFLLMNNYPNPFNLSTSIRFALPIDSEVSLRIYNIAGQLVRSFEGDYEAGVHTITWDGTNTKGEKVSSGIYFYKLVAGDYSCMKKMVLVK